LFFTLVAVQYTTGQVIRQLKTASSATTDVLFLGVRYSPGAVTQPLTTVHSPGIGQAMVRLLLVIHGTIYFRATFK
jgi:hypothetical protein